MQPLCNAHRLARLVLAWFALTVLAAGAAPMVQPPQGEWVCSGGVMKLLAAADAGEPAASVALDCPLCLAQDAPPPAAAAAVQHALPLGHAVQPIPAARIAALTAAPLPARGPPSLL